MKVKKNQLSNNKGFSLIEVLLAIVILALVSAPILQGFIVTANTSAKAREIMEATDVAQLMVEEISATTFEDGVKSTFFVEEEKERIPSVGYTAPGSAQTLPLAQLQTTAAAQAGEDTKKIFFNATSTTAKGVAIPNVEFDGTKYDVTLVFVPNTTAGTTYYTYDVTVSVYEQGTVVTFDEDGNEVESVGHFSSKLVELKTEIPNKY